MDGLSLKSHLSTIPFEHHMTFAFLDQQLKKKKAKQSIKMVFYDNLWRTYDSPLVIYSPDAWNTGKGY